MMYKWIKRLFERKQGVQLECLNDRIVITDGKGKIIDEYVLKEMRIGDNVFKCPNHPTFITECDLGYACDACPYNPDLRENYKGVKVKW